MSVVTDFVEAIREYKGNVRNTTLALNLELICANEDPYQVIYQLAKYIDDVQAATIAVKCVFPRDGMPEDIAEYVDLYDWYIGYLRSLGRETLDQIDNDFFGEDLVNVKRRG